MWICFIAVSKSKAAKRTELAPNFIIAETPLVRNNQLMYAESWKIQYTPTKKGRQAALIGHSESPIFADETPHQIRRTYNLTLPMLALRALGQ
jgi:hypothetical protein